MSHFFYLPPSETGEAYCFRRRQPIFSFERHVIYHLKGLWEYIPKSIPSVCLYLDLQTNGGTLFIIRNNLYIRPWPISIHSINLYQLHEL